MTDHESEKEQSGLSRRSFLKTSAAAGLGAALAGSVLAQKPSPPPRSDVLSG
jgi:uncharacterized protein (DUF1501 family)